MALSREERIRRAQSAIEQRTRPRAVAPTPSRPRPSPTQTRTQGYTVPAPGSAKGPTLKERQEGAWGTRALNAIRGIEDKRPYTGGAAVIAGTAYVNKRLQSRHNPKGRPYGATGKTTGTEFVVRSRDYMGQIPTYEALGEARNERMPRSIRKASIGPRRAFRSIDFGGVAKSAGGAARSAARSIVSSVTPSPRPNFVPEPTSRYRTGPKTRPIKAGPQAVSPRRVTAGTPSVAGTQAVSPRRVTRGAAAPAGSQATNVKGATVAQRASESIRGGRSAPAVFGSVADSPMRQPGTLNIPRAGKRLTGMVTRSPELPGLPGSEPAKSPRPKSPRRPKAPVEMPKAPTVKSVPAPASGPQTPKPAMPPFGKPLADPEQLYRGYFPETRPDRVEPKAPKTETKRAPRGPSVPVARSSRSVIPSLKPEEQPKATYSRLTPKVTSITDVKVKAPLAPVGIFTQPKKGSVKTENVVFDYEGRQKGSVVKTGPRSFEVRYGGMSFRLPQSPTAETAKEPRSPSRKTKAKPSKTWRAEDPGKTQFNAVFAELEKRRGIPTTLTDSEAARAKALGLSPGGVLREKQRAWAARDPVARNLTRAASFRMPGDAATSGVRGTTNKGGRYAVKLAKIAGLMSGAGAVLAVGDSFINPDQAGAGPPLKVVKEERSRFRSRIKRMAAANEETRKYFGGPFK